MFDELDPVSSVIASEDVKNYPLRVEIGDKQEGSFQDVPLKIIRVANVVSTLGMYFYFTVSKRYPLLPLWMINTTVRSLNHYLPVGAVERGKPVIVNTYGKRFSVADHDFTESIDSFLLKEALM